MMHTLLMLLALASYPNGREILLYLSLGSTPITIAVTEEPGSGLHYLNLHDDENTSVRAAHAVLKKSGGRLVELRHSGDRNIMFDLAGVRYTVDPNRIFTDAGAKLTLERNGAFSEAALRAVRAFADSLLHVYGFENQQIIVTLHNNTEDEYSAKSYLPGAEYERDAAAVHIQPGQDPDDFFFVTRSGDFDAIRAAGYNVVLQDNSRATDDGSLSVLAGRAGKAYINVEAQAGHLKDQERMLQMLDRMLR